MKKIICIIVVVLMIASVVYAQKRAPIAAKDLAGLKGTWEGSFSFGDQAGAASAATLEILNDKVPIRAKLTIHQIPAEVASPLGLSSGQNVFESDNGKISTLGTIVWTGAGGNFFEVSKTGDKKLGAIYWYRGLRGDATFTKKK